MIRAMDLGVEQIYKAAQEITDRETIIIFGSDNGAANGYIGSRVIKNAKNLCQIFLFL